MSKHSEPIRCVALLSGGLDSMLAATVMKNQGIEVFGLSIDTGFGPVPKKTPAPPHPAVIAAEQIGIPVEILDISEEYPRKVLLNPRHGYGSAANPCVDCHIEMIRRAKGLMESHGARFIITGEVMGQRPMSQKSHQLATVAGESGVEDILLRPLSAKRLAPTLPEREGWVDREKLYGMEGRGRGPQLKLARELGIGNLAQPAGGCLLTEKDFARKLFDLINERGKENITSTDLRLLKTGRHFRLSSKLKLIVGRDEAENLYLEDVAGGLLGTALAVDHPGPIAIIDGEPDEGELRIIAEIVARYGQGRKQPRVLVRYEKGKSEKTIEVKPMDSSGPERWRI